MFAIFSLRRPDILPVGDLGVQRGVVRWFLARHSPTFNVSISPEKLPQNSKSQESQTQTPASTPSRTPSLTASSSSQSQSQSQSQDPDVIPSLGGYTDESSIPPAPTDMTKDEDEEPDALPMPFTPSINKTLSMIVTKSGEPVQPPEPLPVGMTVAMLKGRLDPKKKVKWV